MFLPLWWLIHSVLATAPGVDAAATHEDGTVAFAGGDRTLVAEVVARSEWRWLTCVITNNQPWITNSPSIINHDYSWIHHLIVRNNHEIISFQCSLIIKMTPSCRAWPWPRRHDRSPSPPLPAEDEPISLLRWTAGCIALALLVAFTCVARGRPSKDGEVGDGVSGIPTGEWPQIEPMVGGQWFIMVGGLTFFIFPWIWDGWSSTRNGYHGSIDGRSWLMIGNDLELAGLLSLLLCCQSLANS